MMMHKSLLMLLSLPLFQAFSLFIVFNLRSLSKGSHHAPPTSSGCVSHLRWNYVGIIQVARIILKQELFSARRELGSGIMQIWPALSYPTNAMIGKQATLELAVVRQSFSFHCSVKSHKLNNILTQEPGGKHMSPINNLFMKNESPPSS